jgi:hypothetical protein
MNKEDEKESKNKEKAFYEFGPPCPPIESIFFPNAKTTEEIKKGAKDDSPQSS